jgi:hypothetical protein
VVILVMEVFYRTLCIDRLGFATFQSQDRALIHEEGDHIAILREKASLGLSSVFQITSRH